MYRFFLIIVHFFRPLFFYKCSAHIRSVAIHTIHPSFWRESILDHCIISVFFFVIVDSMYIPYLEICRVASRSTRVLSYVHAVLTIKHQHTHSTCTGHCPREQEWSSAQRRTCYSMSRDPIQVRTIPKIRVQTEMKYYSRTNQYREPDISHLTELVKRHRE